MNKILIIILCFSFSYAEYPETIKDVETSNAIDYLDNKINSALKSIVNLQGTVASTSTVLNISNGGTSANTALGARSNLGVPSTDGTGAVGTWNINITGNASNATDSTKVLKAGDTMSGNLNLNSYSILNVSPIGIKAGSYQTKIYGGSQVGEIQYTLPISTDEVEGRYLQIDGNGNLSWQEMSTFNYTLLLSSQPSAISGSYYNLTSSNTTNTNETLTYTLSQTTPISLGFWHSNTIFDIGESFIDNIKFEVYAERTAGDKNVALFAEMYFRDTLGNLTYLGSSSTSSFITSTDKYEFTYTTNTIKTNGRYLFIDLKANVSGGSLTPSLKLYFGKDYQSKIRLNYVFNKSGSINTSDLVKYSANSSNINLSGYNITNGGNITANYFYGNGSNLTSVPGDNLGSHLATKKLNMDNFPIVDISSAYISGVNVAGDGLILQASDNFYFYNDGKVGINTSTTALNLIEIGGSLNATALKVNNVSVPSVASTNTWSGENFFKDKGLIAQTRIYHSTGSILSISTALPNTAACSIAQNNSGQAAIANCNNIKLYDSTDASFYGDFNDYFTMTASNMGFAIPTNSVIKGIEVKIRGKSSTATNPPAFYDCLLQKSGSNHGSDKCSLDTFFPNTTYSEYTLGSDSDLWGGTWTPADINGSGFGFYSFMSTRTGLKYLYIDYVAITIYYGQNTYWSSGYDTNDLGKYTINYGTAPIIQISTDNFVYTRNGILLTSATVSGGDNLGNHIATTTLNMNSNNILSVNNLGLGGSSIPYKFTITGGGDIIGIDNATTLSAKNSSGTYERFLWPRWSDNVMYLNYGSGGMSIRNNASTQTMFLSNGNNVYVNTSMSIGKASAEYSSTLDILNSSKNIALFRSSASSIFNIYANAGIGIFQTSAINNNYALATFYSANANDAAAFGVKYVDHASGYPKGDFFIATADGSGSGGVLATRLYVKSNGDFGVGTSTPTAKLDIFNGDIKLSSSSYSGGIIYPDGSKQTTASSGSGGYTSFVIEDFTNQTNGTQYQFTLSQQPLPNSLQVSKNGLVVKSTGDYTLSGQIITFVSTPAYNTNLLAQYAIGVSTTQQQLLVSTNVFSGGNTFTGSTQISSLTATNATISGAASFSNNTSTVTFSGWINIGRTSVLNNCPSAVSCSATCSAGTFLIGGGCQTGSTNGLISSAPSGNSLTNNAWNCVWGGSATSVNAIAICARIQ